MVDGTLKSAPLKHLGFDDQDSENGRSDDALSRRSAPGWLSWLVTCGHRPSDTAEQRRQKSLFTLVTVLKAAVCAGWYIPLWFYGAWAAGTAPFIYQMLTLLSVGFFARSKDLRAFHQRQMLLILLLPVGLHAGLGGFAASGGVMMWSFLAPLGSVLFQGPRESIRWLWAFFGLVLLAMGNELFGLLPVFQLPEWMQTLFFAMNFCCVMGIVYAGVRYFGHLLEREKEVQVSLNRSLKQEKLEQERLNTRLEGEKRAQENLNEALKAANRHKSSFLAGMSHELRTPLNAIIGFTRLVKRKGRKVLPERQLENLDKVLVSSNHLLTLINDILDLSKIEAGQIQTEEQTFVLQSVLRESLQTSRALLRGEVDLIEVVDDTIPPMRSDPKRVKQILLNLLSNAAKFTHEGHIKVTLVARGAHIALNVEDTGIGISEEAHERVFEEFQQADNSTTRQYGGTGLGLPISRRLARLLGGDLTFESTLGEGAIFTLLLPLHADAAPLTGAGPQGAVLEKVQCDDHPMVLTIDDDPDARYLLRECLERSGYEVTEAGDGDEGIEKARQLKPCVIVLDIMMPGKDGWQTLHGLGAHPETREIPIIISSIVDNKQLALDLGAREFLAKPLNEKDLLTALELLLKATPRTSP